MKTIISKHFELVPRSNESKVNSLIYTGNNKYVYIFYIPKSYTVDDIKQLCADNHKDVINNVLMKNFEYKSVFKSSGIYL